MSNASKDEGLLHIDSPALDSQVLGEIEQLGESAGVDLVGQLAEVFVADARLRVIDLGQAIIDEDSDALRRAAHNLTGASATLGATGLARLCSALEVKGLTIPPTLSMRLVEAIGTEIERVQRAFEARDRVAF